MQDCNHGSVPAYKTDIIEYDVDDGIRLWKENADDDGRSPPSLPFFPPQANILPARLLLTYSNEFCDRVESSTLRRL